MPTHCGLKKKPDGQSIKGLCGSHPKKEGRLFADPLKGKDLEGQPILVCGMCRARREKVAKQARAAHEATQSSWSTATSSKQNPIPIDEGFPNCPQTQVDMEMQCYYCANTLADYFDRRARMENVWGKEPDGYLRKYDK